MHESERIFKQIVSTGHEWKGCEHCGRRFAVGEILTAVQIYSGMVVFWECSQCTEEWLGPYDDEMGLTPPEPPSPYKLLVVNVKTGQLEEVGGGGKSVPVSRSQIGNRQSKIEDE